MLLIIGLGNPGKEYIKSRHNIGFMFLDQLAKDLGVQFKEQSKHKAEIATAHYNNVKLALIKPQTYMNLSGETVLSIMQFYKCDLDDLIVIHDDLDLELADIRFKKGGGNGGHNGLKSIDKLVGNNYERIRIGISRPQNQQDVSSYVLANFDNEKMNIISNLLLLLSKNIDNLVAKDWNYIKKNIREAQ